jgi:REP element-mobilizing transposase RayT
MARLPRYGLPGQPQHVIQRGNNRSPIFFAPEDYVFFLECLREGCERYSCAIHAYVLMTHHVHLLVRYRSRRGTRSSVLSDFFIGAHAAVRELAILTRNTARIRSYFPTVALLAPE